MLVEALDVVGDEAPEWKSLAVKAQTRLTRWAAIQERVITPDGTYPKNHRPLDRVSLRGVSSLPLAALRHTLAGRGRTGAGARCPHLRDPPHARDERRVRSPGRGLQIGVSGHQPAIGETYISTGSLYLCSAASSRSALPASDAFWSGPAAPTTWPKGVVGRQPSTDHGSRVRADF